MDPITDQAAAPPPRPPRKTYVTHPPVIWERARERYAAGATAGEVAREMGVSVSAVRLQASRGGWTRRDLGAGGGATMEGRFAAPLAVDDPEREAGPTWIRLSDAAWESIRAEYVKGATAKALSKKWGVSQGSIYRHTREEGWTKEARGAEVSQAMLAREAEARAKKVEGEIAAAEEARARAARAPAESDPLVAGGLLLRQAAGAAVRGEVAKARELVALSQALRAAHDAFVGPYGVGAARKEASEALALAAHIARYEDLKAAFEVEGEAAPSPTDCAWLIVNGGSPEAGDGEDGKAADP